MPCLFSATTLTRARFLRAAATGMEAETSRLSSALPLAAGPAQCYTICYLQSVCCWLIVIQTVITKCSNPSSTQVVSDRAHNTCTQDIFVYQYVEGWRRLCRRRVSDTHDRAGMWVQVYSVFARVLPAGHGGPAGPPPLSHTHCLASLAFGVLLI